MKRIAKSYNKLEVVKSIMYIADTTGIDLEYLCNPCFEYIENSSDELAQDKVVLSVFLLLLPITMAISDKEVESYIGLLINIQKERHISSLVLSKLQVSYKYDLASLMADVLHLDEGTFKYKLDNKEISHKTLFKVASLSQLGFLISSNSINKCSFKVN